MELLLNSNKNVSQAYLNIREVGGRCSRLGRGIRTHCVKGGAMIIRVVLKDRVRHAVVDLGHLDFKVFVEVFIPKDDIIRVLSFVMSDFL